MSGSESIPRIVVFFLIGRHRAAALLFSLLIFFGTGQAYAEPSLNRQLINDCPKLLEKLEKLSDIERASLIKGLISAISFEIAQAIEPPPVVMPQSLMSSMRVNSPWSAIQGGQALQAKHCAIDALQILKPFSSEAIPELTRLGWNRTVPPDLRKVAQTANLEIIEAVESDKEYILSPGVMPQLLGLLEGEYRIAAQNSMIGLSSKILPDLLAELKSADDVHRTEAFSLLPLIDPDGLQVLPSIKSLLSSSDPRLRTQALGALLHYPQKLDQPVYNSVIRLLGDSSTQVQGEAARVLSEIVCMADRIGLSPFRGIEPKRWLNVISKSRACQPSELGPSLARLLPDGRLKSELTSWYSSGAAAQRELAIDILAWTGDSDVNSRRLAVRALKDSEPTVRLSALRALIQLKLIDYEVIREIINTLGDQDDYVRRLAQDTLIQLGPRALEPLRSARASTPLLKKIGVYYALTRIDPKFSSSGLERDIESAECRLRFEIAMALATVRHGDISPFIWECRQVISVSSEDLKLWWDALSAAAPLSPAVKTKLTEYIQSKDVSPESLIQFVDHAPELGFDEQAVISTYRQILGSDDDLIRDEALTRIVKLGDRAKPLVENLQKLFDQLPSDNLLRHDLAVALAHIDSSSLNFLDFFIHEFDSDRLNWAQGSLARLEEPLAKPILIKALSEVHHKRKYAVLRSIGKLGPSGVDLEPQLIKWLDDDDPLIKYETAVALLKVHPDSPQADAALRVELNAMLVERLAQESLPKNVLEMLVLIHDQSHHLAEKRRADILTAALRTKIN